MEQIVLNLLLMIVRVFVYCDYGRNNLGRTFYVRLYLEQKHLLALHPHMILKILIWQNVISIWLFFASRLKLSKMLFELESSQKRFFLSKYFDLTKWNSFLAVFLQHVKMDNFSIQVSRLLTFNKPWTTM